MSGSTISKRDFIDSTGTNGFLWGRQLAKCIAVGRTILGDLEVTGSALFSVGILETR